MLRVKQRRNKMNLSDFISIISVIIAVVSTVIAAVAIKSANTINNKEIILQNYEDMKDWFEEMVFMMKDLYLRYPDNKKKDELKESLVRFSTYIDLGRIFFKNQQMGEYKINKPEVFRGRRVILLDVIVLYYNIYKLGLQAENQEMLWGLQRAFISEMITLLNQNKFSKKYVEYTFIDEKNIIDRLVIEGALKEFPQREQKIIILRYFKQKTQSQIAQSLGISQVQVSRLEKKILKELKEKICG